MLLVGQPAGVPDAAHLVLTVQRGGLAAGPPAGRPTWPAPLALLGDRTMTENEQAGFEVVFTLDRATKRTFKYEEVGDPPRIGSLYVQKHALGGEPAPARLGVRVVVLED